MKYVNKTLLFFILLALSSLTNCDLFKTKNSDPSITIVVEDETPPIGSTQYFKAKVTDPDANDVVTVTWTVGAGTLSSITGDSVLWTAPDDTQLVEIIASGKDLNGGSASATKFISVGNEAPKISSFTVSSSHVLAGNTISLNCTAEDPEGYDVTYNFTVVPNEGILTQLTPYDNTATWEAPPDLNQSEKKYEIIVEVMDILNYSSKDTVDILVYSDYGSIWVIDSASKLVTKYSANGEKILSAEESFERPIALANNIDEFYGCYVADYTAGSVFKIDAMGKTMTSYSSLPNVIDIDVHHDTRTIWALSVGDNSLTIIDGFTDQVIKTVHGFSQPRFIRINQASDEVWIVEPGNNRIINLNVADLATSIPDTITSLNTITFTADTTGNFFNAPYGIYMRHKSASRVYIADKNDYQVERLIWDGSSYKRDSNPISIFPLKPIFVNVMSIMNLGWVVLMTDIEGNLSVFPESNPDNINVLSGNYSFNNPHAISVDEINGICWIGDNSTNQLVKIQVNYDYTYTILKKVSGFLFIEDIVLNK